MPKQYGTPGPRYLFPSASTSPSLAAVDPLAQLLFDRLVGQADDQGRLQGDPYLVKAACMPRIARATAKMVDRWLGELEGEGMILRYQAAGQDLIQLRNWWTFQASNRWIYASRWPAPPGWDEHAPRVPKPENLPESLRNGSGSVPERFQNSASTVPESRAREPNPTKPSRTQPAPQPAPRSVSTEERRANLTEAVAAAQGVLDSETSTELAKTIATKALDKARAALEQLPIEDSPSSSEDDVDFGAPAEEDQQG